MKQLFPFVLVFVVLGASVARWVQSADPNVLSNETLIKSLIANQKGTLKSLERKQKLELKELKASQELQFKEWQKAEDNARHQFFESHPKGGERRDYVHDFIRRRDELRKEMSEGRSRLIHQQEVQIQKMKADQAALLKRSVEIFNQEK